MTATAPEPTLTLPHASGDAVLSAAGLRAGFGSHAVLHGVDISVRRGEVAGIFGLNGAGKSVTLKVLAGLVPAWSGEILLEGRSVVRASAEERVKAGIGNVPQGRQVFPELTVEENLRLGAYPLRRRNRARYGAVLAGAYERFPMLARLRDKPAGTLSGGEQASLAVARALMSEPTLLLIDEPSAGLAPRIVEELFVILRGLNAEGLTILIVEQNVTFGLKLVDTAHLLRSGRVVYSGPTASLDRERVAAELGIGRLLARAATGPPTAPINSPDGGLP